MSEVQEVKELKPMTGSQSKVLRILAMVVSYLFHPVFMTTIMAIALYKLTPVSFAGADHTMVIKWIVMIGLYTAVYSLIFVALLKGLGFIKSIHMDDPKDRIIPLIGIMIFYWWVQHVFKNLGTPFLLQVLLKGSFWGIVVLFMVSIFFKVSMHTAAAGGMLGILLVLMFTSPVNMAVPFFIALIIAGIIGTARMVLGAHRIWEIWIGYLLGIAVQVAAYFYLV